MMAARSTLALLARAAALSGGVLAASLASAQSPPAGAPPSSAPPAAPAPPAVPVPTIPGQPPLVGVPGDPGNVDEVVLPERSAVATSGKGKWDDGLVSIQEALERIKAGLTKLGMAPAGRPLVVYTKTTDDDFEFDAMIPVAAMPVPAPELPAGLRVMQTPSGKAYRFTHKGSYDDVDTTYETITTYLDAKDIVAKDAFVEEFLNDPKDGQDGSLEMNIYVQPK